MGRRTLAVLTGLAVLVGYLGAALLGYLLLAAVVDRFSPTALLGTLLVVTLLSGYLSYRFATVSLLRSLDARPLPRGRAPELHRRVDRLAERMALDRPDLLVTSLGAPNALALGSSRHGALVLDAWLFRLLDADELTAIVAHELAHLENDDGLVRAMVHASLQTAVGCALVVAAPVALVLTGVGRGLVRVTGRPGNAALRVRAAIGALVGLVAFLVTASGRARARRREFAADERAAEVTGDPLALARALRKIERASAPRIGPFRLPLEREEHPIERLLSTHPPTDERVERLAERARGRRVPIE